MKNATLTIYSWVFIVLSMFCFLSVSKADDIINLNVTGNIIASPCNVTWPLSIVDLGMWSSTALNKTGPYANTQLRPQKVTFSSCPAGTSEAVITFTGAPNRVLPATIFANTNPNPNDSAWDIGLQLFYFKNNDLSSATLAIGNNTSVTVPLAAESTDFTFFARMITLTGNSTPGKFISVITMNVTWQ
ncbi:hypothetical protein ACEU59_21165 [Buttiauxella noackiae]|uniref:hypothetical protein n=1 Tax=Buttiauxella noackiae TaxID=82992 RepID=UPI0035A6C308